MLNKDKLSQTFCWGKNRVSNFKNYNKLHNCDRKNKFYDKEKKKEKRQNNPQRFREGFSQEIIFKLNLEC